MDAGSSAPALVAAALQPLHYGFHGARLAIERRIRRRGCLCHPYKQTVVILVRLAESACCSFRTVTVLSCCWNASSLDRHAIYGAVTLCQHAQLT